MLFREEEKNVRDEFFFFPENVIDDSSGFDVFRDGSRRDHHHRCWRRDDVVLRAEFFVFFSLVVRRSEKR